MRAAKAVKDNTFCDCKSNLVDNLLEVTIPLLKPIIDELCTQEPQKRGSTLALWLLERTMAPSHILESLREWNASTETAPLQAPPGPRPEAGSPLKTRVNNDSIGTRNTEEVQQAPNTGEEVLPEVIRKSVRLWSSTKEKKMKDSSDEELSDRSNPESIHSPVSSPQSPRNSDRRMLHRSSSGFSHSSRKRRFTMNITHVETDLPPRDEVVPLLQKVPAFSQLCQEDLQKLVDVCTCSKYEAGENIAIHGAVSDTLHIILEGSGKVSSLSQVATLAKGDYFGEDALRLSACTNPTQVSAGSTPITTLSLSAAAFQDLGIKPPMLKRSQDLKARKGHSEWQADGDEGCEGRHSRKGENVCQDSGRPIIVGLRPTKEEADVIKLACANNKIITEVMQLSEEQCCMIADSVYCVSLQKGDVLFNQGDSARAFYIIREGLMSVDLGGDGSSSIHLQSGTSFGEVALLYDSPRTATLKCSKESTTLWVLPRNLFKKIASLSFQSRIKEYSELLGKIPIITDVFSSGDLDMLADVIEEVTVHEGEALCEIGRDEGLLFIIYSGECALSKDGTFEETEILKPGDWVGEDQVVNGVPADVSVRAVSEIITALVLDDSSLQTAVAALKLIRKRDDGDIEDHVSKEKLADKVLQKQAAKARKMSQDCGTTSLNMLRMEKMGMLGEGSFGTVVLLRDRGNNAMYALKAICKEHIIREKIGPAIQNERSVMTVLESDFIVRFFGCYEDPRNVFFVLEAVFGGDLYDVYNEKGLFGKIPHAKFYIGCVTLGLEHMHQKRVIYRDLKLENCLLDSRGYAKLTDMGIAKMVIGKTYTICGTADYFAPETLRQSGHNRAVDWWAAGVLLFIMVVGRSPFDAEEVTEIYKNIVKGFSKVNFPKTVTSDLSDVIKSLCRKKPEERVPMQKGGVDMLKEMPWFNDFDWVELALRTLEGPYLPPPADMEKIAAKKLSREVELQLDQIQEWDGHLGPQASA